MTDGKTFQNKGRNIDYSYDVAKIDRWKDAQRDERLEALCAKGVVPKQTLDFVRNFNK